MKRQTKIILGIILFMVAITSTVVIYNDDILKYLLVRSVDNFSKGDLSLVVEEVDYKPFKSEIKLKKLNLISNDSVKNKGKASLYNLGFDSVVINNIYLWKLFKDGVIRAGEVLTAKPELIFWQSEKSVDTAFSIKQQIRFLSDYSPNTIIPLEIDTLRLKYGNLEFRNDSTKLITSSANFSVELFYFNTIKNKLNKNAKSFAFSEHIVIDISKLYQKLKNGRTLRIEKLEFNSKNEDLNLANASLSSINTGIIDSLMISELSVGGISLTEFGNLEEINLNSININTSYVSLFPSRKNKNSAFSYEKVSTEIVNFLESFTVDTLRIKDLTVDGLNNSEKLYEINGLSINLEGFKLDSSFLVNGLYPNIDKSNFSVANLKIFDDINITTSNIYYSSEDALLSVLDFKHINNKSLNISSKKILFQDIQLESILKSEYNSSIKIKAIEPDIKISLETGNHSFSFRKDNDLMNNILLSELEIVKGRIKVSKGVNSNLSLNSTDIIINFNDELTLSSIRDRKYINKILWNTEDLYFENNAEDIILSAVTTSYDGSKLHFTGGKFEQLIEDQNINSVILNWEDIILSNFELFNFIYDDNFKSKIVDIQKPIINLRYKNIKKYNDTVNIDDLISIPIDIDIKYLNIKDGLFEVDFNEKNNKKFSTGFAIIFENFMLNGALSKEDLKTQLKSFKLSNTLYLEDKLKVNAQKVSFLQADSSIKVNKVQIETSELNIAQARNINADISVEYLNMEKLYLDEMIQNNNFHFRRLKVDGPELDLSFDFDSEGVLKSNTGKLDIYNTLIFDNIDISGLETNLEFTSQQIINRVSFENTFVKWQELPTNSGLEEIFINLNKFSYKNDTNSFELLIDKVSTETNTDDLQLKEIKLISKNPVTKSNLNLELPSVDITEFFINKDDNSLVNIKNINADTLFFSLQMGMKMNKRPDFKKIEEKLGRLFNKFFINELNVENAGVEVLGDKGLDNNKKELLDFKFSLYELGYSVDDSVKILPEKIYISLKENQFLSSNGLYTYKIGDLNYNITTNSFLIDSFEIKPKLNKSDYFKHFGYQVDRFEVACGDILGNGLDIDEFIESNTLIINKLEIDSINSEIFRDKTYKFKTGIEKPMPADLPKLIEQAFLIDSLVVSNSKILYGEYVNKSNNPGVVYFDDFELTATNITNIESKILENNKLKIDFNTSLMGKPKLDAQLDILLDNPEKFSFRGKTEEMDFGIFNSLTENLFGISIIRGNGSFNIDNIISSDSISKGFITFKYKKLRIALYDRDKAELNKGVASPFFKFLVNDLLIKSNNPRWLGNTRQGLVYYTRDKERSFLNYMWKSLVSGIMSTMWHNSKEQRREKRRLRKISIN
ncbi:MAG: hypothetical protein C0598_09850 [Marinilabiliales bacterium]|nr:MAG: hypothetical protein C0598_09850 [Marinilabiliales bacterium]